MSSLFRYSPRPPFFRKTLAAACLLGMMQSAQAVTYTVTTEAELRQAIINANANSSDNYIDIKADIELTGDLPPLLSDVTLRGNNHTLDGASQYRLLVLGSSNSDGGPPTVVQVTNLTLNHGLAAGGNGADGGGGGLGAGGAVLVNSRAIVSFSNVSVLNSTAAGGFGALGAGGGGGGLGGAGGSGLGGGGGGLLGDGGATSGGGGGLQGNGGAGSATESGGGGGYSAAGGNSGVAGTAGSQSVYWQTGTGGDSTLAGGALGGGGAGSSAGLGAGGGGFNGMDGGAAGASGDGGFGGGGAGAVAGAGGDGGFGGGGGGSATGSGGAGGFGGGGGGSATGSGGAGGFGGGGGGSLGVQGGAGGFGAGGGSGSVAGGQGGVAGGVGGITGGGGGGALGGGVLVMDGGYFSIKGGGTYSNNAVAAAAGAGDGMAGEARGSGMFLQGAGRLVLGVKAGETLTFNDDISDAVGSGLLPASSFQRWSLAIDGGGPVQLDPANPDGGLSYGTVILGGNNTIAGSISISGADAVITSLAALGSGGVVGLNDGGLILIDGLDIAQDFELDTGGGRIGVASGEATLSNNIAGAGSIVKTGAGTLTLNGTSSHTGAWVLFDGALKLDANSRLGNSALILDGGTLLYGAAFNDLRHVTVSNNGGTIDNGELAVTIANGIGNWNADTTMTFSGGGTTTLTGAVTNDLGDVANGSTVIAAGRVEGAIATGELDVAGGATYALNGSDRLISGLNGAGVVELGNERLAITIGPKDPEVLTTDPVFGGVITGAGGLTISRSGLPPDFDPLLDIDQYRFQTLGAGNTYSGGTTVGSGAILSIADDSSIGSGPLTLTGGVLSSAQGSSSINIILAGGGGIFGDMQYNGVISGAGTFVKYGAGTLTLNNASSYAGKTMVLGEGSYLALANPNAVGLSTIQLTLGGGLKILTDTPSLRPIEILDGVGVVDIGSFDVQSSGDISGLADDSSLRKEGSGRLLVTGNIKTPAGVDIAAGKLQIGNGGLTGSLTGNVVIGTDAQLEINRSGEISLDGNITGNGSMLVSGPGTVTLNPEDANTFIGGLTVNNGFIAAADEYGLGFGEVTLNAGGLLLLGDIKHDLTLGALGGTLAVGAGNSFTLNGDIAGTGNLTKSGDGALIYEGVVGHAGIPGTLTTVAAGTLQIGTGATGTLLGDVDVNTGATLIFNRNDLSQYDGVIDGAGTVIKRGDGELALTGEQLFTGVFNVEAGNLRIGLGGTVGSLSGDVALADTTQLIFDRSDDATFNGSTSGAGLVRKSGPGKLTVLGDMTHTGGTLLNSGILIIGNGGTVGNISGDVTTIVGTQLAFNRSDSVVVDANVGGAGSIVQRGNGTVTLTGTNTQTGGVSIEKGVLAIDSDARLGDASGKLVIKSGGILRYLAAFDDLRDINLEPSGGGLDTGGSDGLGLDINYLGLISGSGNLIKAGLGRLTVTRLLVEGDLQINGGDLRLGDGSDSGGSSASLGNAYIANGATLSLNRNGFVNFEGSLTGGGSLRKLGGGQLSLPGDSHLFAGTTYVDSGSLRINGTLGGDVEIASATFVQGNGSVLGNLNVAGGGEVAPGNSIGTLSVGSLTLNAGSQLAIEANAKGDSDKIIVAGSAVLGGTLHVIPQAGDYTVPGCCTYSILTAANVSGTFSALTNDLTFLSASVEYLPTVVNLSFGRNSTAFSAVSLTQNQRQVSSAIDAMAVTDPTNSLSQLLVPLTAAEARAAFDTMSGDTLLSSVNASARVARRFSHVLSARSSRLGLASHGSNSEFVEKSLAAVHAGMQPEAPAEFVASFSSAIDPLHYDGPTAKVEGVWVEANAMSLSEDADNAVGSASSTFSGTMLALGMDGYWRDNLIVGFGAGYVQGDTGFDNRSAEGSATGTFLGAYSRWETGSGGQYKAALTLGQQSTDQTRKVSIGSSMQQAASSVGVSSAVAELEAGMAVHLGSYGLRPYARMDMQYLQRDAISETGASSANLSAAATTDMLGELGIGAEISRPWLSNGARWAQIVGGVALMQPFGDTQREQTAHFSGSSNTFVIKATPDDGTALQLTFGAEWYLSKSLAVWGGYEGRISSSTQEHNGVISTQYRW